MLAATDGWTLSDPLTVVLGIRSGVDKLSSKPSNLASPGLTHGNCGRQYYTRHCATLLDSMQCQGDITRAQQAQRPLPADLCPPQASYVCLYTNTRCPASTMEPTQATSRVFPSSASSAAQPTLAMELVLCSQANPLTLLVHSGKWSREQMLKKLRNRRVSCVSRDTTATITNSHQNACVQWASILGYSAKSYTTRTHQTHKCHVTRNITVMEYSTPVLHSLQLHTIE